MARRPPFHKSPAVRVVRALVPIPLVGAVFMLAVGGCGHCDSDHDEDPVTTQVFDGIAARDGFVSGFGVVSNAGPYPVYVGDDGANTDAMRGFLSFDHAALQPGAEIVAATLFVNQVNVGATPFADLGPAVVVDHVDIGSDLDPTDYDAAPLAAAIGDLSTSPTLGSRWLDVTDAVQEDVTAGRTTTDFRLAFAIGNDFQIDNDFVMFTDADDTDGTHVLPTLFVTWR